MSDKPSNTQPPTETPDPALTPGTPPADRMAPITEQMTALENRNQFILPTDFDTSTLLKNQQTVAQLRKPNKTEWIRAHPKRKHPMLMMRALAKDGREESFLVIPVVAQRVPELCRPVLVVPTISFLGAVFFWPLPIDANQFNPNAWNASQLQVAEHARLKWVRMVSNHNNGSYDAQTATAPMPNPAWPPDAELDRLFSLLIASRGIADPNHPIIRAIVEGG